MAGGFEDHRHNTILNLLGFSQCKSLNFTVKAGEIWKRNSEPFRIVFKKKQKTKRLAKKRLEEKRLKNKKMGEIYTQQYNNNYTAV